MTKQTTHEIVTAHIVAAIEAGAPTFQMPWIRGAAAGAPVNVASRKAYRGINTLMLWGAGMQYTSSTWGTFKQWKDKGASVRKGEKGTPVVFFKKLDVTKENAQGEQEQRQLALIRHSFVFNADQVDGYEAPEAPEPRQDLTERLANVDRFCTNTGARIEHGGAAAFYRPSTDHIQMPPRELFTGTDTSTATESYYSTLLHELTHWTGNRHRLDRLELKSRKGYAFEELVAELGAAMLCQSLEITPEPRPDHAAYLASWLEALKNDDRAIFKAAAEAQKACDYLEALQAAHTNQEAA